MALLRRLPTIVRTRKFYPADAAMLGPVKFRYRGREFGFEVLPSEEQAGNLFSLLRELFVREIYFGPFRREIAFRNCLDLGCNIGIVSHILSTLGGPDSRVVGVDATDFSQHSYRQKVPVGGIVWLQGFICSTRGSTGFDADNYLAFVKGKYGQVFRHREAAVSPEQLLAHCGPGRIDFLKADIEGAEFDIFTGENAWLDRVDNIAMEVHRNIGNPRELMAALSQRGFKIAWKGNHKSNVPIEMADYLYASRNGMLAE